LGSTVEDGRVVYHAISPWSMPSKQLYGYHDEVFFYFGRKT